MSNYTLSRTLRLQGADHLVRIEIDIELRAIESLLFDQILRNRTGRTRMLSGLIKAKLLKKERLSQADGSV